MNTISNEIKPNSSCSLHVVLNYLHQEMCWMRHTARRFNCFAHTTCLRVTTGSQDTELPPPSNTSTTKALGDFFFSAGSEKFGNAVRRGVGSHPHRHCYCVTCCVCKFCVLMALRFAESSFGGPDLATTEISPYFNRCDRGCHNVNQT